jgi:hypothetical protein
METLSHTHQIGVAGASDSSWAVAIENPDAGTDGMMRRISAGA